MYFASNFQPIYYIIQEVLLPCRPGIFEHSTYISVPPVHIIIITYTGMRVLGFKLKY